MSDYDYTQMAQMALVAVAVLVVVILSSITLYRVTQIKGEVVPSVQIQDSVFDVTLAGSSLAGTAEEGTFRQPANSKILSIQAIPLTTVVMASSGTLVGKAGIATAGTDIASTTLLSTLTAAANLPVALSLSGPQFTSVARTVYIGVLTGTSAVSTSTDTVIRFVVRYETY